MKPRDETALVTRMRFEDPETFLEFHDKQLERAVVGVRHPQPVAVGTAIWVVISPPGAPDRLRLPGRVMRVKPRADGTVRLRVQLEPGAADRAWLAAYVSGLRAGIGGALRSPTASLDQLDGATYYALLGLEPDANGVQIRLRFAESLRRVSGIGGSETLRRRLTEAYGVLRDRRLRTAYDAGLRGPSGQRQLRLEPMMQTPAPATATHAAGLGDQYWRLARRTLEQARGTGIDRSAAADEALRLLRVARVFEPGAQHIAHALEHVRTLVAQRGR